MIIKLENIKDHNELLKGDVLLDFNAKWCGPCKMMEPHLLKLSELYPDLKIISIDTDLFPSFASNYSIYSIPTFIYLKNGITIKKSIGYIPFMQLERLIK